MPRTTRPPKTIESFGPEVLQGLIEGSKREITLELPYRKAAFFRQRANALRAAMRAQKHTMYPAVSQATIRIIWGEEAGLDKIPETKSEKGVRAPANRNERVKLVISPADSEFGEALKQAGVEVKPLSLHPPPNTGSTTPVEDVLADYLKEEPNAANQ